MSLLARLALALGLLVLPASAQARTFDVRSCDDAQPLPGAKADDAWQSTGSSASAFTYTRSCPSTGAQFSGLVMQDVRNLPLAERPRLNDTAEWRFTAPAGAKIVHVRVRRDVGIRTNSMRPYGRTAEGVDIDTSCQITGENFTCDVGGPMTPYHEVDVDTTAVRWGIECWNTGTRCTTGATLHNAWAMIYGSVVTIDDPTLPTLSAVGGPLFSGGWKRGMVDTTATATDNTGIASFRWYRSGSQVAEVTRTCDYSRTVPCTTPPAGSAVGLDTSVLPDGEQEIALAVTDAAGNETMGAAQTVQVDNTAPGPPTGLTATGGGSSPSYSLRFGLPGGQASPITTADYRICPPSGPCQTGSVPVSGPTGEIPGLTAAAGASTVTVWLTDEAGNVDPANAATTNVSYVPPSTGGGTGGGGNGGGAGGAGGGGGSQPPTTDPPPATPPAPPQPPGPTQPPAPPTPAPRVVAGVEIGMARVTASGRLVVRGRLDRAATGAVRVVFRATVRGRPRTRTATAPIHDGRFTARVDLPRTWPSRARRARVVVRYTGSDRVAPGRARAEVRGAPPVS